MVKKCKECKKEIPFEDEFDEVPSEEYFVKVSPSDDDFVEEVRDFFDSIDCLKKFENDNDFREAIRTFAFRMEKKMSKNDDTKGDSWKSMTKEDLRQGLHDEFWEFEKSLEKNELDPKEELIDIANFCMMLYFKYKWYPLGR